MSPGEAFGVAEGCREAKERRCKAVSFMNACYMLIYIYVYIYNRILTDLQPTALDINSFEAMPTSTAERPHGSGLLSSIFPGILHVVGDVGQTFQTIGGLLQVVLGLASCKNWYSGTLSWIAGKSPFLR
jgi:hypothetical protein